MKVNDDSGGKTSKNKIVKWLQKTWVKVVTASGGIGALIIGFSKYIRGVIEDAWTWIIEQNAIFYIIILLIAISILVSICLVIKMYNKRKLNEKALDILGNHPEFKELSVTNKKGKVTVRRKKDKDEHDTLSTQSNIVDYAKRRAEQ
ncbi:MAG: hypothetical protein MSA90_07745 [Faecalicatena sp.]|uniref:hypothetical protein n=1 Tax=Faecalicatena sp. TaxID=2005360 RepID=UPI002590FDCF|nr:hypothetical protein [Faecalicatena sp.]MCI6465345.1 hypothetical protein [Faecalicatena sp.]MDY5617493.1 hypothetical protein [Lachnospiraceae bacterium]